MNGCDMKAEGGMGAEEVISKNDEEEEHGDEAVVGSVYNTHYKGTRKVCTK